MQQADRLCMALIFPRYKVVKIGATPNNFEFLFKSCLLAVLISCCVRHIPILYILDNSDKHKMKCMRKIQNNTVC